MIRSYLVWFSLFSVYMYTIWYVK